MAQPVSLWKWVSIEQAKSLLSLVHVYLKPTEDLQTTPLSVRTSCGTSAVVINYILRIMRTEWFASVESFLVNLRRRLPGAKRNQQCLRFQPYAHQPYRLPCRVTIGQLDPNGMSPHWKLLVFSSLNSIDLASWTYISLPVPWTSQIRWLQELSW